MLARLKLSTKIGGGFAIVTAIAAVLGGIAVLSMRQVHHSATALSTEYVPQVAVANEVERNSLLTMYDIRGYSLSGEDKYLTSGQNRLAEVKKNLAQAKALAEVSPDLGQLKTAVEQTQVGVAGYEKLVQDTVSTTQAITANRKKLEAAAAIYMQNCTSFLDDQYKFLKDELRGAAGGTGHASTTTAPALTGTDALAKHLERLDKIALLNDIVELGNAAQLGCAQSQALRDPRIMEAADKNFDTMKIKFDTLRKITRVKANIDSLDNTEQAAAEYRKNMKELLANWLTLQDISKQRSVIAETVRTQAKDTAAAGMAQTTQIAQDSTASLARASSILVVGLTCAMVISVLIAVFLTRGIVRAFKDIFKGLKTLSGTELVETGATFNRIIQSLRDSVSQVTDAASQVASASQQLASGASEQASSLEETSSALEEMSAMTRTNAEHAKQASELATQARTAADRGDKTMSSINESSDQISKIIKVIEEIAFQTNLLALNAAVEAARAGEHGKGFAVVADEVRNLAQRAAQAAKETTGLIENSVSRSREGTEAIQAIVKNVTELTGLIDSIAHASAEQAQGVEQVNSAVSQMDKVTQQNASGAEESASAAEELNAQAEAVGGSVRELVILVEGTTSQSSTKPNASANRSGGIHKPRQAIALQTARSTARKGTSPVGGKSEPSAAAEFLDMEPEPAISEF